MSQFCCRKCLTLTKNRSLNQPNVCLRVMDIYIYIFGNLWKFMCLLGRIRQRGLYLCTILFIIDQYVDGLLDVTETLNIIV